MTYPSRKLPKPPHNPGVKKLVEGKRSWSPKTTTHDTQRGFRGWNERGYLPHRDEPGLTQFVTFRLANSFPESLRSEWEHLWKIEDDRERRTKLETYLDRCRGDCYLRRSEIGKIVETALGHFHGDWYELRAWCVMPNHVHALFKVGAQSMATTIESWKKHTSQKINRLLNRRGKLWEEDYWDTYMRSAAHEQKTISYIESNPVKAKLGFAAKDWPWSSARFRDEFGLLRL